ncbi:MAG: hypothetical protein IJO73_08655 [Clostridia bacterium]|nr:hypothetical protein [Clostridia bacterium]
MTEKSFEWLPLDNAGKIFPGQNSEKWSNVFRMSVQLKEDIEPDTLKEALKRTLDRIPSFKVRLRKSLFADYFERNEKECPVRHDVKNFCYRINFKENNGYLFRIFYHKSRISIDVYHALCDGYGASVFLCTLAGEYLRLRGYDISHAPSVLDVNEKAKAEEYADPYELYATSDKTCKLLETPAYHKKGTALPAHMSHYTTVLMSFSELHALSKSYSVTVTELLAAILADIHYRKQLSECKRQKDVSVQIPVNLRKAFPTVSLRNFVICLTVKISPRKKEYSFDEIVRAVSEQLRAANNRDFLHAYITQTVKLQTVLLRFVPLIIKNTAVKVSFFFGAEYSTSALLSNLGPVSVPEEMKEHIESFSFFTGPGLVNGCRCGAASVADRFAFTFSNRYEESDIEREFIKKLTDMGIRVALETNRSEFLSSPQLIPLADTEACSDEVFIPSAEDRADFGKSPLGTKEKIRRFFIS